MYKKFVKRPMDFLLSLLGLVALSPVLLIIAITILIQFGHPILFKQKRPGKNEKIFTIYKFRTMTNKKAANGELLSDEIRLTKFGKFLRSTSLDELPELFNILKGDMSIVGPRPLLIEYLPLYNEKQRLRHTVRPGLSGFAQINGRNGIEWEEKFDLDVIYIEKITFLRDMRIIAKTLLKVVQRDGISQEGEATIKDFTGSTRSTEENKYVNI